MDDIRMMIVEVWKGFSFTFLEGWYEKSDEYFFRILVSYYTAPKRSKSYPDHMNKKSLEQRPDMTKMIANKSTQKGKSSIFYKINIFYKNQRMSFDPFMTCLYLPKVWWLVRR